MLDESCRSQIRSQPRFGLVHGCLGFIIIASPLQVFIRFIIGDEERSLDVAAYLVVMKVIV